MEFYYIISATEDGTYLYKMTKKELENDLNSEPGDGYINEEEDILLDYHTKNINLNEITGRIIIKGEIIIPKQVKIVTKWEV